MRLNRLGARPCYIAFSLWEEHPMYIQNDQFNAAVSFNEYFGKAAIEYWTTVSFPALYYAKFL